MTFFYKCNLAFSHGYLYKNQAVGSGGGFAVVGIAASLFNDEILRNFAGDDGGAVDASDDPLVALARLVEPHALELRRRYDDEVEAVRGQASERIARARFAVLGTDVYPDATFTLRVTFGTLKGWRERGAEVYPFTRFGRAFERATGHDPFRLPESWLRARDALDPDTPFNFVATTDIVGGNSGSPAVDARGRLVGLAFDGNIHSIAGSYWFDESDNRTVLVHPAAIVEALKKIYAAQSLLGELTLVE